MSNQTHNIISIDGNAAAAYVAYAFSEVSTIFPISPSSGIAEMVDEYAAHGRKNIFGDTVVVSEMQSEAGAAGALHGVLQSGSLGCTFTASQGFLLMIPTLYKLAAEQLPGVLHVTARSVASHALSIFGDHSDVMSARQTGVAMLASSGVQDVLDLGAIAHLSALKARMTFVHFFDGQRTSHEIEKVNTPTYEEYASLVDKEALQEFRTHGLSPNHPVTRGTAQNIEVFFQIREAGNTHVDQVPLAVEHYMQKIKELTGREYNLFDYYGDPNAEHIIIAMGSVTVTMREVVKHLTSKGEKVGCVVVRLYRPFSVKHLLDVIPKSVKRIAVLDKTKEPGAIGEPLFLDVCAAYNGSGMMPLIVGGRYGLSGKDTTPAHVLSVFDNLKQAEPKHQFTISIVDDVTFRSLPIPAPLDLTPQGTIEAKFFGVGSDGTVSANKNSIKIIGDSTDLYTQGFFYYDSKKAGGFTISHLRFGPGEIHQPYLIEKPHFVSCSVFNYVKKFDLLKGLRPGGTFLLNSTFNKTEVLSRIPDGMKRYMADNDIRFYIINASGIAHKIGLGSRTNTILQAAFFQLSGVVPVEQALGELKKAAQKSYAHKGEAIIEMNYQAIDTGAQEVVQVEIDPTWKQLKAGFEMDTNPDFPEFINNWAVPVASLEGDNMPVSAFVDMADGSFPHGTASYEKRAFAYEVPEWLSENCIACNMCAYVCPHAVIRPMLLDSEEQTQVSEDTLAKTITAAGKALVDYRYYLAISVEDCTGCGNCVEVCPGKRDKASGETKIALRMEPMAKHARETEIYHELQKEVTYKKVNMKGVNGSQYAQPLFEFSGACAGCGETPYLTVLSRVFGDRMIIANATGCSSIYGGSVPSSTWTKNSKGHGPAWANSLFEDNAEFGHGIYEAVHFLRDRLTRLVTEALPSLKVETQPVLQAWLDEKDVSLNTHERAEQAIVALEKEGSTVAKEILELRDSFVKPSIWSIGGDGWAYDIGFGGLDHVLAIGNDINVLVLDTEGYSNTGGQTSKSTPMSAVGGFAALGKPKPKKNLAMMMATYGYVYVGVVSMGANMNHFHKVLEEAEAYNGPSLIIAYSPCIEHGIEGGLTNAQTEEDLAVKTGYWPLWRYNPMRNATGENPFILDSKPPSVDIIEFLKHERRFVNLKKANPAHAEELTEHFRQVASTRYTVLEGLANIKYGTEPS